MIPKDEELIPKATPYKLDKYIYLRLTLWRYMSKYVFCGLPTMQNHLCKVSLEQKVYKGQSDQRYRSNCFSSAFVFLYLFFHFSFCPSPLDNHWRVASHCLEWCFYGLLSSFTPLYNNGSTTTLLLIAECFFFARSLFLNNSHQKSFYIDRCPYSLSKLVTNLKVCVRQKADKKHYWGLQYYDLLYVKRMGFYQALYEKHRT